MFCCGSGSNSKDKKKSNYKGFYVVDDSSDKVAEKLKKSALSVQKKLLRENLKLKVAEMPALSLKGNQHISSVCQMGEGPSSVFLNLSSSKFVKKFGCFFYRQDVDPKASDLG